MRTEGKVVSAPSDASSAPDQNGAKRINQANAPGFADLSGRLTDARNDNLIFSFPGFTANDRAGEMAAFGGLLTGRTIDFLRLVVDENSAWRTDSGYSTAFGVRWQVWGGGEPVFRVSEPASLALVATALVLLGLARKRALRPAVVSRPCARRSSGTAPARGGVQS